MTAGRGFEWGGGGSETKLGAGSRTKGRPEGEREAAGRGAGGLLRGDAPPRLRKPGVPGLRGKETTPRVPEPAQGSEGRKTRGASQGGGGEGGRRPGRLSCPEPGGLCPRHPLPRPRTLPQPPGSHIPRAPPRGPAAPRR